MNTRFNLATDETRMEHGTDCFLLRNTMTQVRALTTKITGGAPTPSPREARAGRGLGRGASRQTTINSASSPRPSPPSDGGEGVGAAPSNRVHSVFNPWLKSGFFPWCFGVLVVLFCTFTASAQNFAIDRAVIAGGGGTSTGGVYSVTGTIGQPATAISANGQYTVSGGFWGDIVVVQTPGAPLLSLLRSGTNAMLAWNAAAGSGFVLQVTPSLTPVAAWNAETQPVILNNGTNTVTVPLSPAPRFYRLRKP
jgi:hypothetical protein